ncbi:MULTISPECIES: hypothetical protein [Streptomyces]|uniref:MFS transporter n=1 Tax=Streptomyces evansiae TaxID=3075535 RepID=A0ABU2RAG6_9ACTN|nr:MULTISPECIES: hypothetical protein [unclassified Streptomyces]MDT0412745.1 hypothetical protein [Streptomyces sp. DSM 41979]MYQ56439.1 hypothetical protein [Streptomyces sp. SID4926]SCE48314.1 hypothetical protein GA0115252_152926 [Streptomyces sp. DfronAA-171]
MLTRVRSAAGRAATAAGTVALLGGLADTHFVLPGIAAAAATAGLGLATSGIRRAPDTVRHTAAVVYAAPHAGCALLLTGEVFAPDTGVPLLIQAGLIAVWTGATWFVRPGLAARKLAEDAAALDLADTEPATEEETTLPPPAPAGESADARWWREEVAEPGIAPGTRLLDHEQISDECVALIIGATERGTVPKIHTDRLSAVVEVPAQHISTEPVPGEGAGLLLLLVGPRPVSQAGTDEETWQQIARTAMPGVELLETNTYTPRKELN